MTPAVPLPDRLVILLPTPDLTTVPVEFDTDSLVERAGLRDRKHLHRLLSHLASRGIDPDEPDVERLDADGGRWRFWVRFRDLCPPALEGDPLVYDWWAQK